MGIKHLWTILTPFGERKPLYELQGKTVAIDLSCWICEAQNITDYYIQPKMYLRNLYFRTCYLLLMQVHPVYVLEGKAPELKYGTIASRNAIQFKGAKPKNESSKIKCKDRSRFNAVLRCCEDMLRCMGIACVKGTGEAESLCAYLNEDGLVHGCISQDSDCFAYGAKVVYRNFSISQQGAHAGAGAVDVYDISKMNFGRNKIIALALLCGSDYCNGVFGVGKEAAMKLFECTSDDEILNQIRAWRSNSREYHKLEEELADKNVCTSCGHSGKVQLHTKNGCTRCATTKGCDFSKFKDKRLQVKHEVNIRSKALEDPNFPDEQLINEFLIRKDNVTELDLQWRQPNLIDFVKFAAKHLQWEYVYAFEKFLPILTRWQLLHSATTVIVPSRIKKTRNPKGVPSYEIVWIDSQGVYKDLIPENELLDVDSEKLWSTIEPQQLVSKAYSDLVRQFEQSKVKPKRKKAAVEDIDKMLADTSISKRKKVKRKCKPIDSYFKKAVMNNFESKKVDDSFNLDLSKFGDESDLDLSDVVDEIVGRKLGYFDEAARDLNSSSFFMTDAVGEEDLFERSVVDVGDSTDEEDSFVQEYVPLLTRLQGKS